MKVVIIAANHSIKAGLSCLGGATKTQLAQLPITKLPMCMTTRFGEICECLAYLEVDHKENTHTLLDGEYDAFYSRYKTGGGWGCTENLVPAHPCV